jgi:hypothetical protein
MNRFLLQAAIWSHPLPAAGGTAAAASRHALHSEQPSQAIQITGTLELTHAAHPPAELPPLTAADLDRNQILRNARTIFICSETDFLSSATLSRALLGQKDWEKLDLSIIDGPRYADPRSKPHSAELQLQIDRVVFTHIHTYVLTERATGVVLAAGRVQRHRRSRSLRSHGRADRSYTFRGPPPNPGQDQRSRVLSSNE